MYHIGLVIQLQYHMVSLGSSPALIQLITNYFSTQWWTYMSILYIPCQIKRLTKIKI